ncbi:DUF6082 family protein [Actinoplanes sp. TRM 88003]|uniref:DUF6082 family protein n=1 Tax=Paractinoplanes aksuensis TaxID=2939490 RepID=A0ABT1DJX9_9ACTN|nr:DUF6082 family protein [Actinoplanes aksuensis]MCO8271132.1 DUF6082 family protein [Actinoplanes aksuensis]
MKTIRVSVHRSWVMAVVGGTAVVGFFAMIVVSPWLLDSTVGRSEDWHRLSEVGQAYGGVSAILAGLAFCGIAGSLLLQWRQVRLTQVMLLRERHFELARIAVDDPSMAFPRITGKSDVEARRLMVLNLWVAHWSMLWNTGQLSPQGLAAQFDLLFSEPAAVEWWSLVGARWSGDPSLNRRGREFQTMANEAHQRAVAAQSAADGQAGGAP